MIKKIGIENFRIFKDYTEFELAPLTVLTGPNNSGKSSFLKLLSLLKNSFSDIISLGYLNFDGGNHNLGSIDKVLNWDLDSTQLRIVIDIPLNYFDEKFDLELIYLKRNEDGLLFSFKIFNKERILLHFFQTDENLKTYQIEDEIDCLFKMDIAYLNKIFNSNSKINYGNTLYYEYYIIDDENEIVFNETHFEIFEIIEKLFSKYYYYFDRDNGEGINSFIGCLDSIQYIGSSFDFISERLTLKGSKISEDLFEEIITEYSKDKSANEIDQFKYLLQNFHYDFEKIRLRNRNSETYEDYFRKNIENGIKKIIYTIGKIDYVTATRGSKERVLSNYSLNEIDAIIKEFTQINYDGDFINNAFQVLGINGKFEVDRLEGVASVVYLKQDNKKINLVDLGFGYSQILPILIKIILLDRKQEIERYDNVQKSPYTIDDLSQNDIDVFDQTEQIWELDQIRKKIKINPFTLSTDYERAKRLLFKKSGFPILIIEEPEANLHPNLQSKLADILVLAYKTFGIHFIVETHSEYLIRKLQYLTAKKEILTDDVNIYYFNADEYVTEREKKVKKIKINEFGGLTDSFGPGFFDEATHLQFELLKLNKGQSN